jgi:putative restriction endonuclease
MRYWWVNQNQTYAHEVSGGYLWSPKQNKNGAKNVFYENMTRVEMGDVVFSFCETLIKAIGVARGRARSSAKPTEFGTVGSNWGNEGWYVPVDFTELRSPIRPKDHIDSIRSTLPEKYSPLQSSGDGNQGVYLAELPEAMAGILRDLLRGQVEAILARSKLTLVDQLADDLAERTIQSRLDIPETEKQQLIMARRGQGLYRARLESIETCCRVTGVSQRSHLRASHLKPWRDSTDAEKLDGNNGLLLSPHVDHLLDRGFISFTDSGDILISTQLDPSVLKLWGVNIERNVGPFNSEQQRFLAFHREHVFVN